jgi:hypothetical protein
VKLQLHGGLIGIKPAEQATNRDVPVCEYLSFAQAFLRVTIRRLLFTYRVYAGAKTSHLRTAEVIRAGGKFFNTSKTVQSNSAWACVLLTFLHYVSLELSYMRRAEAILVVIALVSLPLVLLGQPTAPTCNCICCVRHNSAHSGAPARGAMSCHQHTGAVVCQCEMNSKPGVQAGLLAPLPPTMLSNSLAVPAPPVARRAVAANSQVALSDFLALPFKPPRA